MHKGILRFSPCVSILLILPTVLGQSTTRCYGELGCFQNGPPWNTLTRPVPPPQSPQEVGTKLYCYRRGNSMQRYNITLYPNILLNGCQYSYPRKAVFVVHGWLENGNLTWMSQLKDYYLNKQDVNVFLVDWGPGAASLNYLQAVSNTRIVAAEVTRFLRYLNTTDGLVPDLLHLIGFSLGAQICAYISNNFSLANRITGLDPAAPAYEYEVPEVRLDPTDATNVDIIHTSAEPLIPNVGFGYIRPGGDVDFYMNKGGRKQPGCPLTGLIATINISDPSFAQLFTNTISCSHGRSWMYFVSAVGGLCDFLGHKTTYAYVQQISSNYIPTILTREPDSDCTPDMCTPIGLDTFLYPARGVFIVNTTSTYPYCGGDNTTISI